MAAKILPSDLKRRAHTSLETGDLTRIIEDASGWAEGRCDNNDAPFDLTNGSVREAVILYSIGQITMFDLSAHVRPVSVTEGDVTVKYQGLGGHQPTIDFYERRATEELEQYFKKHSKQRRPRYRVKRAGAAGLRGVKGHGDF